MGFCLPARTNQRSTMVYVHRQVTRVESPLNHTLKHAQGLLVVPLTPTAAPPPLLWPCPSRWREPERPVLPEDAASSLSKDERQQVEVFAIALRSKVNPNRV